MHARVHARRSRYIPWNSCVACLSPTRRHDAEEKKIIDTPIAWRSWKKKDRSGRLRRFPVVRKFLACPQSRSSSLFRFISCALFARRFFATPSAPPFTTSDDPMPDPPSPSYRRFFFILPRASPLGPLGDQWIEASVLFFWSASGSLRSTHCRLLRRHLCTTPRAPRDPHSMDYSLSFSSSLPLALSLSLFLTHTHALFLSRRLSRFFASIPLFPPFSVLGPLHQHISFSPPLPSPLRYRSPPPTFSTSCDSRPFRSSSNSPFHGREKRTGSCPSRTLFHPTFLRLPSFGLSDPAASLSFSLSFSLAPTSDWTFEPLRLSRGVLDARTRGRVYASHIHLHACRFRVSRSRIGR